MVTFAEDEEFVNVGGVMLPKRYGKDASAQAARRKFNKTTRKNDRAQSVRVVWEVLEALIERRGIPPTVRELSAEAHLAVGTVQAALDTLEKNAVIERLGGARSIRLLLHSRH